MAERKTLTRRANDGHAMTVQEIAELAGSWLLARVPGDTVPHVRVSEAGLWSATVTYEPVELPRCRCGHEERDHLPEAGIGCFARVRASGETGMQEHHECPCEAWQEVPRG